MRKIDHQITFKLHQVLSLSDRKIFLQFLFSLVHTQKHSWKQWEKFFPPKNIKVEKKKLTNGVKYKIEGMFQSIKLWCEWIIMWAEDISIISIRWFVSKKDDIKTEQTETKCNAFERHKNAIAKAFMLKYIKLSSLYSNWHLSLFLHFPSTKEIYKEEYRERVAKSFEESTTQLGGIRREKICWSFLIHLLTPSDFYSCHFDVNVSERI
jgi:hypothetical protein